MRKRVARPEKLRGIVEWRLITRTACRQSFFPSVYDRQPFFPSELTHENTLSKLIFDLQRATRRPRKDVRIPSLKLSLPAIHRLYLQTPHAWLGSTIPYERSERLNREPLIPVTTL